MVCVAALRSVFGGGQGDHGQGQGQSGGQGRSSLRIWLADTDLEHVVTPPPHIEAIIVETDPGVRGDTATGGQKPAKLETGAVVRVPLFINQGEVIKVDTRSGEYISRAKQ